jgi:multidrug efflux pump
MRVDRAKANSMGVTMKAIGDTLAVLVGENYVNRFGMDGRSYDVIPQSPRDAAPDGRGARALLREERERPARAAGQPGAAVDQRRPQQAHAVQPAQCVDVPGHSDAGRDMGDAVAFLSEEAKRLPAGFSYDWQSDARQFTQEGSALVMAFVFAIVVIYLVLAAQYESLRDPLIILISVPMSICGALVPLALGFGTINIYTQIGLVTLIGLISKHGILMVEFANEIQAHNLDRRTAIEQAARIRLRPILMTTAAMVVGLVPLLFASGAGANSRFSIGLVIVVGMLVGTLFTLFVLPTMYTLLARDHRPASRSQRAAELELLVRRRMTMNKTFKTLPFA